MPSSTESFLHGVQNEVHNYFKGRAEDVVQKLIKASQLAASQEDEDCALLLTEVRLAHWCTTERMRKRSGMSRWRTREPAAR